MDTEKIDFVKEAIVRVRAKATVATQHKQRRPGESDWESKNTTAIGRQSNATETKSTSQKGSIKDEQAKPARG